MLPAIAFIALAVAHSCEPLVLIFVYLYPVVLCVSMDKEREKGRERACVREKDCVWVWER